MDLNNPLLLHIESSSTVCSVAISRGNEIVEIRETNNGFTHAENLALFIQEVSIASCIKLNDLDAISISKGPGSYTGLRIGVATAKGICYSLAKPLISVDTLQSMAYFEIQRQDCQGYFCPMMDARRMEVYCSVYNERYDELLPVEALIVDEFSLGNFKDKPLFLFGDGALKCKQVLVDPSVQLIEGSLPSAAKLLPIALDKFKRSLFEDIAYYEPFYLKEFIAGKKKKLSE